VEFCTFFILIHFSLGNTVETRMWANAQRDGRPAEYRWRPLFNAAKFGWRPLLECSAVTSAKTRNPLKFAVVPQTRQHISAASLPKFTILWRHVRKTLLFNNFSDCRYMPYLRRWSPTKLCDGAQMANFWRIFGDFFASCISSELRAPHFKPAL